MQDKIEEQIAMENRKWIDRKVLVLLGKVNGSKIELTIKEFDLGNRSSVEMVPLEKIAPSSVKSLASAINNFIEVSNIYDITYFSFLQKNIIFLIRRPEIACIGVEGQVENDRVQVSNIPNWAIEDGNQIAQMCQLQDCKLINNYQCNAYGLDQITIKDYYFLTSVEANPNGVKCITGPGTGYGEAVLYKSAFANHHDVIPSEGGHVDFAPRTAEDIKMMEFAKNYIETSNNVENIKSNGRITRVSVERLCSGPAVPLLYEFYK